MTPAVWDGLACVICGREFVAGARSVPAGHAYGGQVFACAGGCASSGRARPAGPYSRVSD